MVPVELRKQVVGNTFVAEKAPSNIYDITIFLFYTFQIHWFGSKTRKAVTNMSPAHHALCASMSNILHLRLLLSSNFDCFMVSFPIPAHCIVTVTIRRSFGLSRKLQICKICARALCSECCHSKVQSAKVCEPCRRSYYSIPPGPGPAVTSEFSQAAFDFVMVGRANCADVALR